MMKLYDATPKRGAKHNQYCGPAALAAVTGITTGDAAKALRDACHLRAICGVHEHWMLHTLRYLKVPHTEVEASCRRYEGRKHNKYERRTLAKWVDDAAAGIYLIVCGHHWLAIHKTAHGGEIYMSDSFNRAPILHEKRCVKSTSNRSIVTYVIQINE